MRTTRNILIGLSVGILLLAGIVFTLDLGALKPVYERIASHYLQEEVRIGGPMSLRVGETLTVSAHDITVTGKTEEQEPLVVIGYAEVHLSLPALIDRAIDLPYIALTDAAVLINIDESGMGNWPDPGESGDSEQGRDSTSPGFALRLDNIQLERAEIHLQNKQNQRRLDAEIARLQANTVSDSFTLSSQGTINERVYETELTLNGVQSLLSPGPWEVDWQGQIGRASYAIEGDLAPLDQWRASRFGATLHADSANDFLASLALPLIDDGPVDITIDLEERQSTAHLELAAHFGEFSFTGAAQTTDPLALESGTVNLIASGPNLAHLGALAGQTNWPDAAFGVDLRTSRSGNQVNVETLLLKSDAISVNLSGTVADYRAPGTGRLTGNIEIPSLEDWSDVLNLPASLSGTLTGDISLTGEGAGADVVINTNSELMSLAIGGRLEPGESMLGSTLTASGSSEYPHKLAALLIDAPPDLPPATFQAEFQIEEAELLRLQALTLQLGGDRVIAEGMLGWSDKQHASEIRFTAESADLRDSLSPWAEDVAPIPSLPVRASGKLTHPEPEMIEVLEGTLQAADASGKFSGTIDLQADTPAISGLWNLTFPTIQPLLTQLTVSPEFEKPLEFQGSASWQPGTLAVSDGTVTYGSTELTGDLTIDLDAKKLRFDLLSSTPDLTDFVSDAATEAPLFSVPVKTKLIGELNDEMWSVEAFELESTRVSVTGNGFLELDGDEFVYSHITGDVRVANLSIFADVVNLPLPKEDLRLTLDLDSRGGTLVFEQFDLQSGSSDLSVSGGIANPSNPVIALDLRSEKIDLAPWIAEFRSVNDRAPAPDDEPPAPTEESGLLIPDYDINLDELSLFQSRTTISVAELLGLARPVRNIFSDIELGKGGLRVTEMSAESNRGGKTTLTGDLIEGEGGVPQLTLRLDGEDIILGIPKAPSEDIATLPSYAIKARLAGDGQTTREVMTSLDGYINVTMGEGKVLNAGLDRITNSFLQELSAALNPFQEQQESTNINCGAAFVTFSQGQLSGKPAVVVDTPNVKIFADTAIALDSEQLQVQFKTVPQKGLGFSMSSLINPYIEVTGTLAKPRLSLNPGNTMVAGSLAVVTGGISVLVRNVMDRLTTSGNVCAARLAKANEQMADIEALN